MKSAGAPSGLLTSAMVGVDKMWPVSALKDISVVLVTVGFCQVILLSARCHGMMTMTRGFKPRGKG